MAGLVHIQAINRHARIVVTEEGRTYRMDHLLDGDLEEVEDLADAEAAMCGEAGCWFVVWFKDYQEIRNG